MTASRTFLLVALASVAGALYQPADAQKWLDRVKKRVTETKNTLGDAQDLRCEVQGVCGTIRKSNLFAPDAYESVAVTAFDGTGRYGDAGTLGLLRDAFEGRLVDKGYMLAANTDADKVRAQMARGAAWTDEQLAQLKEFVNGIDAVLVVDVRRVDLGRCELNGQPAAGLQATAHISARWVHVDAGDVPWVATHKASICEDPELQTAQTNAIDTAARQLATSLPVRNAKPPGQALTTGPERP